MSMPRLLGYWTNGRYPDPSKMQDPEFWKTRDKAAVIAYLKSGLDCNHYLGFSGCRICGVILGTHEMTDGVWCWPKKLEHYVEAHDVVLPEEFIGHVSVAPKPDPAQVKLQLKACGIKPDAGSFYFRPDETFWVEWGKKRSIISEGVL